MLTKRGHVLAAYVLYGLGLCHWLTALRLDTASAELAAGEQLGAEPTAATTEPAD